MFKGIRHKLTRKPTVQTSTARTTRSTLPTHREDPPIEPEPVKVPTYAHADQQKGAIDTETEQRGKDDEIIEKSQGRDSKTDATPSTSKPSHKGKGTERHTEPHTFQDDYAADSNFEALWHAELGYDVTAIQHGDYNEWTPNCLALFQMLAISGHYIRNNRILIKNHPDYLDYAVACYYAIIFFIQILRARKAAGKLTGEESSFLRRFDRAYPEESLPIADWMFPILSSIVSTQPEDAKYEWIVPRIATELFFPTMNGYRVRQGSCYLQPLVPYMLGILRFAVSPVLDLTTLNAAGDAEYFDDEERFVPHRLTATATTVFGINNIATGTDPTHPDSLTIFAAAGVSYPFHANEEQLSQARAIWRRTKFRNLDIGARNPGGRDVLQTNPAINNLESFLLMPKSDNIEWFGELVTQAAINARFGNKVYNLSQVPQTGGNETLLIARLKKPKTGTPARVTDYADVNLGIDNTNISWYPTPFEDVTACFGSTRATLRRSEILQASAFAVNAAFPITNRGSRVGATHLVKRTKDFTGATDNRADHRSRYGDYWSNNEWTYTMFDFEEPADIDGKPMFARWSSTFQEKFYNIRPAGY